MNNQASNTQSEPTAEDITAAHKRIGPFAHRTPLLRSQHLDKVAGCQLYLKCEHLQKTGSFKVRGAGNKIAQLNNPSAICTHSSGNHGQAVAYVGGLLGLRTKIVMPRDTPNVKKNAVRGYGAEVVESGPTAKEQQEASKAVADREAAQLVHPYNDWEVIAGAATVAKEIFEDVADLDYVVFPVGGGGLASGTVLARNYFSPKAKAIGVEPYLARDAYLSLKSGQLVPQFPPITMAEGVRTGLGDKTFQVINNNLDDIILVSERQMVEASQMLAQRTKMVVELSGSLGLAAVLADSRFRGKKVGVILSGGNIDMSTFFGQMKAKL